MENTYNHKTAIEPQLPGGKLVLPVAFGTYIERYLNEFDIRKEDLGAGGIIRDPRLILIERCIVRDQLGISNISATNTFRERGLADVPSEYIKAFYLHLLAVRLGLGNAFNRMLKIASFGPKGDCYTLEGVPTQVSEARDFHDIQAYAAAREGLIPWFETFSSPKEAIGAVLASKEYQRKPVVSFVIDKNGNLLDGTPFEEAISMIDGATDRFALGYGLNCCNIESLQGVLAKCEKLGLRDRIITIYPNASTKDISEIGEDDGQIHGLGANSEEASSKLLDIARSHRIKIVGWCCGALGKDVANLSNRLN